MSRREENNQVNKYLFMCRTQMLEEIKEDKKLLQEADNLLEKAKKDIEQNKSEAKKAKDEASELKKELDEAKKASEELKKELNSTQKAAAEKQAAQKVEVPEDARSEGLDLSSLNPQEYVDVMDAIDNINERVAFINEAVAKANERKDSQDRVLNATGLFNTPSKV